MVPVGQPPRPAEPGLVHPQHRRRLRLDQLDRAVHDDRPLHRRPRHPMRSSDLGLVPAVLHRGRERCPQPSGGAHPGRHLGDLLGERLPVTVHIAAPPAPLTPQHDREPPPHGRSRGRVSTQSLPDVERTRHAGHRAASGSSVTSCTTLAPSAVNATRSTANPAKPNRHDASSLRSTTARGSPFAAPEHSEDQGVTGRPGSGAPHGSQPQVARSRSKSHYATGANGSGRRVGGQEGKNGGADR